VFSGLTVWLCVAPRTAVAACIPFCLLPSVLYVLLDKEPLKHHKTTNYEHVQYTALEAPQTTSKAIHELLLLFKVFPNICYGFATAFCLHISTTAVLPTLTFPSSPFPPRDHYQYFRLISDFGILFGGLEILLVSCISCLWIEFFKIRRIWIRVFLNVSLLIFFVLASWYHFLPNVVVVLVLCYIQGHLYGSVLVLCLETSADCFTGARDKGTALGFVEVGLSAGRISAGLLGLFVERYLREHCTYNLLLGRFCLARHQTTTGWNTNSNCG
jgi:hypothetical protein